MIRSEVGAAICGLLLCAALPSASRSDGLADFYKGKTIRFIVGYPPSGGYDAYARLIARHLGRHIPGLPAVIVQNMPGASSLKSAQYLARVAPRDGSVLGMVNRGLVPQSRLNPAEVGLDFSTFTWIGSMSSDVAVCTVRTGAGVRTIDDLRRAHIVLADTSQNSGAYIYTSVLHNLFPGNTRIVLGYPGTGDVWIAMEQGEADASCNLWASMKADRGDWFRTGKAQILVQFARARHPDLPEVPLASVLADASSERGALDFLMAADAIARPVIGPPAMDPERASALRAAFDASMKDPDLLQEAGRARMSIDPMAGAETGAVAAKIMRTPEDVLAVARRLLGSN